MDHLCYLCLVFYIFAPLLIVVVMLLRQFIAALWSPAGKGLTSCHSVFMSNCEVVTFPLVSWIRSGALLDRFLIFALFLILFKLCPLSHKQQHLGKCFALTHIIDTSGGVSASELIVFSHDQSYTKWTWVLEKWDLYFVVNILSL